MQIVHKKELEKEIVSSRGKTIFTNSLKFSEEFDLNHKHTLEKIRNLISENAHCHSDFFDSYYINKRNRKYKMFCMTEDGYKILKYAAKKRTKMPNILYIIRDDRYVKIGITRRLKRRVKEIQNGNPMPIDICFAIEIGEDAQKIETKLHRYFKRHRLIGEWFDISREEAINKAKEMICK